MASHFPLNKNELLNYLEDGHFVLLKQPAVELREENPIFGYSEILVRCMLEERAHTFSGSFTALLEQSLLMDYFDMWAIHNVCNLINEESAQPWNNKNKKKYAINLSEQSLVQSEIGDYLAWILENKQLSGECFIFQFELEVAANNAFRATQLSRKFKSLGCQILITGSPEPEQLVWCRKNMNAKYLKVDVAGCSNPDNRLQLAELYRPLVSACNTLDMSVVGQFVDNLDCLKWLKQIGFHYSQGYGVARPTVVPKIDCPAFFTSEANLPCWRASGKARAAPAAPLSIKSVISQASPPIDVMLTRDAP
jgi:diguanylate cyclase